jgi:predicted nucleotidyltransferase component of viral defense system
MKGRPTTNLPASIHQQLLNVRNETGEDFNQLLTRYTLERLLYRLSKSDYADQFILKGALLFMTWTRRFHRPTQDLDLLGYGDSSAENVQTLFEQICQTEVDPDGLIFDPDSITVQHIREGQIYESQRVHLMAHLGNAKIQVQIDIGYGDVITPVVQIVDYPVLLHFPLPRIRAYPPETVVAEKLQATVALGMQNSRMKDFYDLWSMARDMSFWHDPLKLDRFGCEYFLAEEAIGCSLFRYHLA